MKRFRVKIVGLGLALAAGSAVAADGEWRAPGAPTAPKPGSPALLPPALRAPTDTGPIWLPARESGAAPLVVPAGAMNPPAAARPQPTPWPPGPSAPLAPGPRTGGAGSGPLPLIPPLPPPGAFVQPDVSVAPQPTFDVPLAPAPQQPDPIPPPRPAAEPPKMPIPLAPVYVPAPKPNPLPDPRPTETPSAAPVPTQPFLPTAPPELMYPAGALEVNKHGVFGSQPITISRDYGTHHGDVTPHGQADWLASRVYVRGEYLLWWLPGYPVPVLGTTNNPPPVGFLGQPGTTAILGPGPLVDSTRSGFRIRAGLWLNESHSWGLDAGFFTLGSLSSTEVRSSDQFPTITRPFFAPNLNPNGNGTVLGEFGENVALPGLLTGTLSAQGDSRMWGADVNLRRCLFTRCDSRAELFVGYRHLNLRESLTISEDITRIGVGTDPSDPIGTRVMVQDRFTTQNSFHGAQIGAAYEHQFGRWDIDTRASVALGSNTQVLTIGASQVRQRPGMAPMVFTNGGLLAAGPNIGRFEQTAFSVAPELTLNVGYRITPHIRVFAGYNFLFWSNVIRPGDQIDRVVDLTFVPNVPTMPPAAPSGLQRPRPLFAQRDLAINGVQIGLELRW